MASGESRCLAVTKGEAGIKIVKLCRDMCGPTEPATAKEQSPKSIRVSVLRTQLSQYVCCVFYPEKADYHENST